MLRVEDDSVLLKMHKPYPRQHRTFHPRGLVLVLIVFAGALFRLHLLARRDFWVDEALSVIMAQLPWRDFWRALWNFQANMAFYYLLLRGWLQLGDSEIAVRGFSVLCGVAVIPATYLLGKRLFSERAALLSAAFSAINIFQVRYSQEARGYSLAMLLAVMSTYFFLRAIEAPGQRRYWLGYVLVSVLGVYTHLFIYLVVGAHWLSLGYARLRLIPLRTVLWAAALFILLTMPMNAFMLLKNQGQVSWVPRPTMQLVLNFADLFTGNGGITLFVGYAALCLVAVCWPHISERNRSSGFDERWRVRFVAWWLVFPIALTLLVSFFKPVFYDRFMAICAPALALLAGKGMATLDQLFPHLRGLVPVSFLLFFGLSALDMHRYNQSPASQGDSWRLATRYVLAGQQPGDAVFLYRASGNWAFTYYLHRELEKHEITSSPSVVFPFDPTNPQQEPDEEQVALAVRGRTRVWLILQHYEGVPGRKSTVEVIQSALQQNFHLSQEWIFAGTTGPIRVLLYVRRSPG
jgi:mannosyltransferase